MCIFLRIYLTFIFINLYPCMMKRWYEFFRYDIPYALRACRVFYHAVVSYRAWDWWYVLDLFYVALLPLKKTLEHGMEVDETRLPKVAAITRVCEILQHVLHDEVYIEFAEQKLNSKMTWNMFKPNRDTKTEQDNDYNIITYADKLQKAEWCELWDLIYGNDHPGSDMRGWWD